MPVRIEKLFKSTLLKNSFGLKRMKVQVSSSCGLMRIFSPEKAAAVSLAAAQARTAEVGVTRSG